MPHSDGLLYLGKYADFGTFLRWRMRFFVLFHAQKKSLIDKNWSYRRGAGGRGTGGRWKAEVTARFAQDAKDAKK